LEVMKYLSASLILIATISSLCGCDLLGSHEECEVQCDAGDAICDPSGGLKSCEGPNSKGGMFWGPVEECGEHRTCIGGECSCVDPCRAGDTTCDPAGGQLGCEVPDADGCMYWSADEAWPEHQVCRDGSCTCGNPCRIDDLMCYQSAGKVSCEGPDADGCLFWSVLDPCPEGRMCQAELTECVDVTPPECESVNECDYEGQKLCMTDIRYRACKYGEDGCLVFDCST